MFKLNLKSKRLLAVVFFISTQVSIYASEAERNKSYAKQCKVEASQYDIRSDPQSGSIYSTAIYHKCVAKKLCPHYPNKCSALKSRVKTTCKIFLV